MKDNSGKEEPVNIVRVMHEIELACNKLPITITFLQEDWDQFKQETIDYVTKIERELSTIKAENERLTGELNECFRTLKHAIDQLKLKTSEVDKLKEERDAYREFLNEEIKWFKNTPNIEWKILNRVDAIEALLSKYQKP